MPRELAPVYGTGIPEPQLPGNGETSNISLVSLRDLPITLELAELMGANQ